MTGSTILLIDDDATLSELLSEQLRMAGYRALSAGDGASGLRAADEARPDLVILDVMMPGMDGFEACKTIRRESAVPIVMLSARGEVMDRIVGLELGADDYLAKPFNPRELLARIRAVVRRAKGRAGPARDLVRVGALVVDPAARRVTLRGREVELTGYEFALLEALARRAGRVLSREQLMELATGSAEEAFDRTVDVHVSRLRQKLGDDPKHPRLIKTVRGAGYVLAGEGG